MKFNKVNIYDLIEENITDGQLVCDFEVEPATNNLVYSFNSSYDNYFSIISNKIYLTSAGKEAINKDFPDDISKELQFLELTINATNTVTGKTISQSVQIKITRVIDGPPYITSLFEHKAYSDNLYPNERIFNIDFNYNTFCNIIGINATYFTVEPIPSEGTNNIKINLSNNGVNYFNDLDWDALDPDSIEVVGNETIYTYEVNVTFINAHNSLSISENLIFKLVKGSKYKNLPTKNNLEIQAELLASKIVNVVVDDKENINSFNFDISVLKRKVSEVLEKSSTNKTAIAELYNLLMENVSETIEKFDFQNDKIEVILESIHEIFGTTYGVIAEYFKKEVNTDLENKANIFNTSNLQYKDILKNNTNSQLFSEYLLNREDLHLQRQIETLITNIDQMFMNFRDIIYSDIIATNNQKFIAIASSLNIAYDKISENRTDISQNRTRAIVNEENIKNINSRTKNIEGYDLTNWPVNNSWNFDNSNLNFKNQNILSISGSTALKSQTDIMLYSGDDSVNFNGTTLSIQTSGTSTVDADIFTGTANKAKYADLAEYYSILPVHKLNTEPGMLLYLSLDESLPELTAIKSGPFMGIITTKPGFILNSSYENQDNYIAIALAGRVPVIMSNEPKRGMFLYPDDTNPNIAFGTFEELDKKHIGIVLNKLEYQNDKNLFKALAKI